MKKWTKLMAVSLSLVIIASAIAGGVVLADEPADSGQVAPPPQRGGMMPGTGVLTDLLGLTAEEIHDQRLAGASLAQIAAAQGVSEAELVAALTAGIAGRLAQPVANGNITQERADEILARFTARTTEMVNNTEVMEPRQFQPQPRERQPRQVTPFQRGIQVGLQIAGASDLLGLTAEEIHDQRLAGASLAQIAATQGIGEAELVAALTANVADRLAQAVTDGKLTQEQADDILAKVVAHTTETVNNTGTEPRQTSPRLGSSRTDGRFGTQNSQMPNFGGRSRGFEGGVPSDIAA